VVAGDGGVKAELPALVVVSFYRFADFPDHADFRRPLKELCEELVSAQRYHLGTLITLHRLPLVVTYWGVGIEVARNVAKLRSNLSKED
jgi:hypothetical protein